MSLSIRPKAFCASASAGSPQRNVTRLILVALFCLVAQVFVPAIEPARELQPARLHLLYSNGLFLNVNRTNSVSLPDTVICFTQDTCKHPFRDDLIQSMAELNADSQGQQILLLFKTDEIVPFQFQHLDGVRNLRAKHAELEYVRSRFEAVAASEGKPKL